MGSLRRLFEQNREWAERVKREDPSFFERLTAQQNPKYLWIGCSDSRVPANQVVGLMPGEVFVHRNVANVVVHTDLNVLSVIQYAVDVLEVRDIIVCGHYGCGGIRAALDDRPLGLIDQWLRHVQDVYWRHREELDALPPERRADRLCELHVQHQVANVGRTSIVQAAWRRGQPLAVHGITYGISDGILNEIGVVIESERDLIDLRSDPPRRSGPA